MVEISIEKEATIIDRMPIRVARLYGVYCEYGWHLYDIQPNGDSVSRSFRIIYFQVGVSFAHKVDDI